ncbi:MAG: fibronectin type III domain-containing protein [Silvibacterium sp.]
MSNIGNFDSETTNVPAVTATATASNGVHGLTSSNPDSAVFGEHSGQGIGVVGNGAGGGVLGESAGGNGVHGVTSSNTNSGVFGEHSGQGIGIVGNGAGGGVLGQSAGGNGVHGVTSSNTNSAVFGEHSGQGIGVFGISASGTGIYGAGPVAFGAVIGKALQRLSEEYGLIPILVALQLTLQLPYRFQETIMLHVSVSPNPPVPSTSMEVSWSFDPGDVIPDSVMITEYDSSGNQITSTGQIAPIPGGPVLFAGLKPDTTYFYQFCTTTSGDGGVNQDCGSGWNHITDRLHPVVRLRLRRLERQLSR